MATTDFGVLPRVEVLRRHGPGHPVPNRPRPVRSARQTQPRRRFAGCATRASGSCRSTAGRRSRSTAGSSSGADSRWTRSGGGPGLVEALTQAAQEGRHYHRLRRARHLARGRRRWRARCAGQARRQDRRGAGELPSSWPPAASRRTPSGARATSDPAGSLPRCAGTRFNTGDGIRMALEIGAHRRPATGRAATPWAGTATRRSSATSRSATTSRSTPIRSASWSTPTASVSSTRARISATTPMRSTARVILTQPGQFAWQVFDHKVQPLLRDEYRIKRRDQGARRHAGRTGGQAGGRRSGPASLATIKEFNAAGDDRRPVRSDRRRTGAGPEASSIPKSNWANRIDEPPFEAFEVTCGITFTFGGLRINTNAEVIDTDGLVIPGLYAAGEIVGGLYYFGYPSGSGLMSGAVFGRVAGRAAGVRATSHA